MYKILTDAGISPEKAQKLTKFGALLIEKNKVMNLTAITEPDKVAHLHFLDSLAVLQAADCKGKTILDVGCGAGFPGVPVAICEETAQVTLLDSLQKRMNWLQEVLPQLDVQANVVAARAEEYAQGRKESFDICTSRAVARLNVLCELCLPYVKLGGKFLALKGTMAQEEADEAANAIKTLGGEVREIYEYPVLDAVHRIVIIEKVRYTPKQYPRAFAKIKQKPL